MNTEDSVQRKKDIIVFFVLLVVVIIAVVSISVAGTSADESSQPNTIDKSIAKDSSRSTQEPSAKSENQIDKDIKINETKNISTPAKLPKLIDLGSTRCKPCIAMEPILEELKNEYSDCFNVEFINVNENQSEAQKYNIKLIPTQIFFDAEGKELFRHVGFYSKEEIIIKWNELGVKLTK